MPSTEREDSDIAALVRAANLRVPAERYEALARDLAAARELMSDVRAIGTDETPVPFRPDWSEPTGESSR